VQKTLQKLPRWLLLLIGVAMVAVIGLLDYLSGDYSMLIFYAVPVAMVAWFVGCWGAAVISLFSGVGRFISDYFSYSTSSVRYWNSLQDMIFLLLMGMLIATVHSLIDLEQKKRDD
jgi:K+-sensing histidine kinase KdpD